LTDPSLSNIYRAYIDCLNRQNWVELEQFVHDEVHYNGEPIGLPGYREMLERDFREIADLYFNIQLLICEPPRIASPGLRSTDAKSRLQKTCSTSSTGGKSKRYGRLSIR